MSEKKTFADLYWERACGHVKLSDPVSPLEEFAQFVADKLYDFGIRDDGHSELVDVLREARRIRDAEAKQ
ncbi:hypothetical protein [Planctomycetes bacterium TBK1r]|uniref:Uncharacterized protein n=1 Tax=Stieleria magnilauensis TaxID=2527963 RepID=A0ABX5XZT4_9BACT|nr:hypothetical protein TBK1r_59810 [Planctomycetes bacterium TBK1r]QDV87032.1 hypothetical protein TBK1r_60590 [Planctomycetes bacterium TBK1r]